MVYVTRRVNFSAAHRLFNPTFSEEQNEQVFDKCNNFFGHGHNYVIDVTVKGMPDPQTGYVIDLKQLKAILEEHILSKVDHKHLNFDVEFFEGIIPTAEHIAVVFWREIENKIPKGTLHKITVYESDNNFVEYFGEPVTIPKYDTRFSTDKEPFIKN